MLGRCLSLVFGIFIALSFSSCEKDSDFSVEDNNEDYDTFTVTYSRDGSSGTVTKLLEHTSGSIGFPIVIMADGYTQTDITNGTYRSVVNKAINALFGIEPMTTLKPYCDVYEVAVPSSVSGITTQMRNTAFSTYHKSTSSVEINGDTTKIQSYAYAALRKSTERMNNALIVMLCNSDQYAGVTWMSGSYSVTDSICKGYSISFVPVGCKSKGISYFTRVLQHEAIGHGIGKLDDEYYNETSAPSEEYINNFNTRQKIGMCLNTHYDTEAVDELSEKYFEFNSNGNKSVLLVGEHDMEPGTLGYRLAQNSDYASEKLKWYQGASQYMTIGKNTGRTIDGYYAVYLTEKNFYRPSWSSMMNSVITDATLSFNALSRFLIYARVIRVATGKSLNIHNEEWYNNFVDIDNVENRFETFAKSTASTWSTTTVDELPPLASPHIIILK